MSALARPSDVATTGSIVNVVYEILSGPASAPRDWERWRTLYAPSARLIPIAANGAGVVAPQSMTPEEYIASRTPWLAQRDFYEWETARSEQRDGSVAHVWSRYEASVSPRGPADRRGANSIQLWYDGTRWWILSVAWDSAVAMVATAPVGG